MNPPAAVLDTNVWLDWLVFADPGVEPLRASHAAGRLRLLGLPRGRDELAEVMCREAVRRQALAARQRRGLPAADLDPAAALAEHDAIVTLLAPPPPCPLLSCSDPDDQCFVDLAVAAQARWLVTKDRALLALARRAARHFGLAIVPPRGFHAGDSGS